MSKNTKKSKAPLIIICLILAAAVVSGTFLGFRPYYYDNHYMAPLPANLNTASVNKADPVIGDFYVSPDGDDNAGGTHDHPFATLEKARDEARKVNREYRNHIVIALMAGTYQVNDFTLSKKDSGSERCPIIYSAYGDGEVILEGTQAEEAIINIKSAKYIAISNITFKSSAADALKIDSNNIDITGCTFENGEQNGIVAKGKAINIMNCEISGLKASAIKLSGGDTKKLTPSENRIENCLIYKTGLADASAPAVTIDGVGNICTNNEFYNLPGCAVYYSGNNNLIDYNHIHHCLLVENSAAAIGAPDGWTNYGNLVRYNLISTIGNGSNLPTAVRACSGTQVRGNMFINIPGIAVDLAGGRDIEVSNNLIINSKTPVLYQSLALQGERYSQGGTAWSELEDSPYKTEIWQEAFKQYTAYSTDFAQSSSAGFAANPAGSRIVENLILQSKKSIGEIDSKAQTMSTISNNAVVSLTDTDMFTDAENGIYTINRQSKVAADYEFFKNIPFDTIGRY